MLKMVVMKLIGAQDRRRAGDVERQDREIHGRAGLARCRERRIDRPAAADAVAPAGPRRRATGSAARRRSGSSQKEMLFMRGKAMSGAPIINGTNQLAKPPISGGHDHEEDHDQRVAVVNTLNMCLPASSAASPSTP
jgi:hypothetical protein